MFKRIAVAAVAVALITSTTPARADDLGLGSVAGFVDTDAGWTPYIGDTSGWTGAACQPKLHADTGQPDFTDVDASPTRGTLAMTITGWASVYVGRWDCGSQGIIGMAQLTDQAFYGTGDPKTTGWRSIYSGEVAIFDGADLRLDVSRSLLRGELPNYNGTVLIEAGGWWGKPDAATGRFVYYPAGCVQQSWLYTVMAASGTVTAQPYGPERPCAQPPLPPSGLL